MVIIISFICTLGVCDISRPIDRAIAGGSYELCQNNFKRERPCGEFEEQLEEI